MAEYLKMKGWDDTEIVRMIISIGKDEPCRQEGMIREETQRIWKRSEDADTRRNGAIMQDQGTEELEEESADDIEDDQKRKRDYADAEEDGDEYEDDEGMSETVVINADELEQDSDGLVEDDYDPKDDDDHIEEDADEEPDDGDEEPTYEEEPPYEEEPSGDYDPDMEEIEPEGGEPDIEGGEEDEPGTEEDEEENSSSKTEDNGEPKMLLKDRYANARDHLHKSDFTFALLNIEITGGNGKKVNGQIISAPLDANDSHSRIIGCSAVRGEKNVVAISEEGVQELNFTFGGFPLTVKGTTDGGRYSAECSIPEHYIKDGTVMRQQERTFGTKGHVILGDQASGTYVHILPMSFKNGKNGETNILYCVEREDEEAEIGTGTQARRASFMFEGRRVWISPKWSDDEELFARIQ